MARSIPFTLFFLFSFLYADPLLPKKTVCLNMIVKDEADVIQQCLGSVKPLVDYWVIVDTGSTDGTQQLIKNFLKDLPGELHERPWIDFSHNRNEALTLAKQKADYILFIDADEVLEYAPDFSLPPLDRDFYWMKIRAIGGFDFQRIALIKDPLDWKWYGVLHEKVFSYQAKTFAYLPGLTNLCNTSTGARSKVPLREKYLKDAEILKKALQTDPYNSRNAYFLAQSYQCAGVFDLAEEWYKKRSEMISDDFEETFRSFHLLGRIQHAQGKFDSALQSFLKAAQFYPFRAEPLFYAAGLYRSQQNNPLIGYLLMKHALTFPYPITDQWVEYMVYDYGLQVELANCALALEKYEEALQIYSDLLRKNNLPQDVKNRLLDNYWVIKEKIFKTQEKTIPQLLMPRFSLLQ